MRSPDEREEALCTQNASKWAARRDATAPHAFGDVGSLERLVSWIEEYGIDNAVKRFEDLARGRMGYGRPNEEAERRSFAFAGLVALWRGARSHDQWPIELADRLPPAPGEKLLARAHGAAQTLADLVITRDAELRLIWDGAPDGGAGLRAEVESLARALE